jgi:K+/H+ antiporter YhaU regulatory subunit KhtT
VSLVPEVVQALDRNISILQAAGADMVMSHASTTTNNIINLPSPGKVLILTEGLNIFRHRVHLNLAGKTLVSSNIRRDTGCSVIAIRCRSETMITHDPAIELDANDEMIMIGTAESDHLFTSMYPEKS